MLRTYGEVSRFMDGLGVNYTSNFIFLKDITDRERFGKATISHKGNDRPTLFLQDISSGRVLAFEGDQLDFSHSDYRRFTWFPSVKEVGVLYDRFDNDVQRSADMTHNLFGFVANELFYETARRQGTIIDADERQQLIYRMHKVSWMYAFALELLYAGLNGNRDVLMVVHKPLLVSGNHIPTLDVGSVKLNGNLDGFLSANPEVKAHLTDGKPAESGVPYDTPEKIMARLRKYLSEEVLNAGYERFKAEREAGQRLAEFRKAHPEAELEDRIKSVDTEQKPVLISLGFAVEDLQRIG